MSEITNLFKATVKAVKARQKAQGLTVGPDKSILGQGGTFTKKGEFAMKSKEVVCNISQLRDFLLEHRKDYINAFNHLGRETSKMTDAERDQIDADAESYMRLCSEAIKALKSQEVSSKTCAQVKEHRDSVLSLVETYLKGVCNTYSEQRAIRVKRVVDKKKISRLEPEPKKRRKNSDTPKQSAEDEGQTNTENVNKDATEEKEKTREYFSQLLTSAKTEVDEELSPEELQMFEHENQQIYDEMNSMVDEVKQIEGKVVEISRLQEIFSEKVLDQEKDIDRIAGTVVGASENIKEANEDIREAMKNNAGLRVWILFFLIVCSFSLLFLDWYNP